MMLSNLLGNLALKPELTQQLENAIANSQEKNLTQTEKALELTFIYAEYAQFDEAIATLKSLINIDNQNAMVFLMLGDLLAIKGDLTSAREHYTQAIASASNSNSPQDRDVMLIAKAELADGMLQQVQAELQALEALANSKSELSERLKAIFNEDSEAKKQLNMLASTGCNCTYSTNPDIPGVYKWIGGQNRCRLCPVP